MKRALDSGVVEIVMWEMKGKWCFGVRECGCSTPFELGADEKFVVSARSSNFKFQTFCRSEGSSLDFPESRAIFGLAMNILVLDVTVSSKHLGRYNRFLYYSASASE